MGHTETFFEIKQGIVKAKQKGGFESIGIDTWGVDFGLLDEHGDLLESAVHYRDDRTLGMQEEVFKVIPKEEVYNLTGNQFENFNNYFPVVLSGSEETMDSGKSRYAAFDTGFI